MNTFQSGFTSGPANYLTLAPAHSRNLLSCGYVDPELDGWIDRVWETDDDAERADLLRRVSARLAEEAVIFPPVRVLFSLRLITSLFRRGHIERFMAAAGLLLFNGVLIVYFYERDAPGANITTLGSAMWWAVVTVSTVGYGDTYPVTIGGRVVATGIMAIGILALAVITAQVSSSYVDQAARRRAASGSSGAKAPLDAPLQLQHLTALHERLDRIEAQIRDAAAAERSPSTDDDL